MPFTLKKMFQKREAITIAHVWAIGIVVAAGIVVLQALYAAQVFVAVFRADGTAHEPAEGGVESLNRAQLLEAVESINRRTAEFDRRSTTPPAFPNPTR